MGVDTVNGHVVIPHQPNAALGITHGRIWQGQVARALSGGEHRVAMRQRAPRVLRWGVAAFDVTDLARLSARLTAARLSGYACAPFWGRGMAAESYATDTVELGAAPWAFLDAGDYVLARQRERNAPENWQNLVVDSVGASSVTFTANLQASFTGRLWIWPLLFGRFNCSTIPRRSAWNATVNCELRELATKAMHPPGEVDLITNGTFDDGAGAGWTFTSSAAPHGFYVHWTGRAPVWGGLATQDVITPTYDIFSDVAGPGWSRLYQDFTIPASLAAASLTWNDRILKSSYGDWLDGTTEIKCTIRTTADVELVEVYGSAPGDPYTATGPNARNYDATTLLQAHLGETLRLQFDVIHGGDYVNWYLDDVHLLVS